ncbi:hypothetical protein L2E82_19838 [Cichorium intybus]|uniref:Uncharacterized protein n=1 Tax=Cichorium intybus TaxID=13427 RepID=A0ACB9DSP0_CICIN|nr:hypothetical protein L2E82_19838 [Cichorium intybus]
MPFKGTVVSLLVHNTYKNRWIISGMHLSADMINKQCAHNHVNRQAEIRDKEGGFHEVALDDRKEDEAEWLLFPVGNIITLVKEVISARINKILHFVPVGLLERMLKILDHHIRIAEGVTITQAESEKQTDKWRRQMVVKEGIVSYNSYIGTIIKLACFDPDLWPYAFNGQRSCLSLLRKACEWLAEHMTKSIHNSFPAYEGIGIHSNPQQETSKLGIDVEGNVPDEIQDMVLNSLKSPPQLLLSVITYTQRLKSIIAKEIEKIDIRADAETLRRRLDGCRVKMMNQRLFSDEDDEPGTVFGYIKIVVKVRFSEGDGMNNN